LLVLLFHNLHNQRTYEHKLSLAQIMAVVGDFLNIFLIVVDVSVEGRATQMAHPVLPPQRLNDVVVEVILEQLHFERVVFIVVDTELGNLF
jgi:hypothetical protein